tara:strand:- start:1106 stop:1336 length:231 start_codon:yes stop_codon:yes gene_type:complete
MLEFGEINNFFCTTLYFFLNSRFAFFMKRNVLNIEFPNGVKHLYVNGKRFNKSDFLKTKELEKRRGRNGRFISLEK